MAFPDAHPFPFVDGDGILEARVGQRRDLCACGKNVTSSQTATAAFFLRMKASYAVSSTSASSSDSGTTCFFAGLFAKRALLASEALNFGGWTLGGGGWTLSCSIWSSWSLALVALTSGMKK